MRRSWQRLAGCAKRQVPEHPQHVWHAVASLVRRHQEPPRSRAVQRCGRDAGSSAGEQAIALCFNILGTSCCMCVVCHSLSMSLQAVLPWATTADGPSSLKHADTAWQGIGWDDTQVTIAVVHPAVCQRGGCCGEAAGGQRCCSACARRPRKLPASACRGGSTGGFAFRGSRIGQHLSQYCLSLRGRHPGVRQLRGGARSGAGTGQTGPGHTPSAGELTRPCAMP